LELKNNISKIIPTLFDYKEKLIMYKNKIVLLFSTMITIWSCAGSNATTMEYRSATTKVRSERDLNAGEAYALKALEMEEHANDSRVAYFLAIEIYKPRRNWEKMNEMLDIAMDRNPNQSLERPFRLDDGTVVSTIADAVKIYKEQIWMNLFNQTVELVDAERFEEAIQKINLAKSVLERVDNYVTACLLYMQLDDIDNAKKDLDSALQLDPNNVRVLEIYGDFAQNDLEYAVALEYYQKALDNTDSQDALIEKLIFIHVELENYDRAIELSDELLMNNPDNPDLYFNVGIIYQRLASKLYDMSVDEWKQITAQDSPSANSIQLTYDNLKQTLEMVKIALGYFMDSSMLEEDENTETERAMDEMKRTRKTINDIYLNSIRQIALDNNVILN